MLVATDVGPSSLHESHAKLEEAPMAQNLPAFRTQDLDGQPVTHETLQARAPVFVVLLRGLT